MKMLLYVSKVVGNENKSLVPQELAGILYRGRASNRKHGVTGMISYRKGYYVQVIEGEDAAVDCLYANISADKRHEDIRILLAQPIRSLSFPDYSLKLVSKNDDSALNAYLDVFCFGSRPVSEKVKKILCYLFDRPGQNAVQETSAEHQQAAAASLDAIESMGLNASTKLSMSGWPDFATFTPSRSCIGLCAMLVSSEKPYSYVLKNHEYADRAELEDELKALKRAGLLVIDRAAGADTKLALITMMPDEEQGSFYSRMKHFLHIGFSSNAL